MVSSSLSLTGWGADPKLNNGLKTDFRANFLSLIFLSLLSSFFWALVSLAIWIMVSFSPLVWSTFLKLLLSFFWIFLFLTNFLSFSVMTNQAIGSALTLPGRNKSLSQLCCILSSLDFHFFPGSYAFRMSVFFLIIHSRTSLPWPMKTHSTTFMIWALSKNMSLRNLFSWLPWSSCIIVCFSLSHIWKAFFSCSSVNNYKIILAS